MYKILLVEDDRKINKMIADYLKKWDYEVSVVEDFKNVLQDITSLKPELILLDVNLPYYDGFYWCREIRKLTNIPILFISSRETEMDKIMGLQVGADDFITKPFSLELLSTKIQAILRRTYAYQDQTLNVTSYQNLLLNLETGKLSDGKTEVLLTPNEYRIMNLLMKHGDKIVSRTTIIEQLWDDERFVDDNTLTVNMNRLRKKLEVLTNVSIETVKNEGYVLRCA